MATQKVASFGSAQIRRVSVDVVTSWQVLSRELAYVSDKPVFFLEDFRAELEREPKASEERPG